MLRTLIAISLVGVSWFGWDVVTDDSPSMQGDRYDQIDEYVADQMDDSRIPGASLAIVEDGAVVHSAGYGNDGRGNAITPDTPFWIGSNTKSVTALAIMQLSEAGSIDLDAPVRTYLPAFRVADLTASGQITIRHLLNQTSGISRIDGLRAVANADQNDSIDDVIEDMAKLELNRPVGESFEYANLNSVVLGAVIEAVTDQPWQDYVRTNIFGPLDMTTTFTDHDAAEAAGLTATHRLAFGFPIETDAAHYRSLAASGYVYASANDMARYLTMYLDGGTLDGQRLLTEAGITDMLTPATGERTFPLQSTQFTARYGAGWFVGTFGAAGDARWHQGSLPHFTTWMVLLPDTDQAVVVMLNAGNQFEIGGANTAWSHIPQGVVDILRDTDPPAEMGTARFFIVFDTLAALAIVAQGWTLAHVAARRRNPHRPRARDFVAFGWELIVAPLLLIAYPGLTGGLGWGVAFGFVPDLSLTVLAITGLAVGTGVARAVRLLQARPGRARHHGADTGPSDPITVADDRVLVTARQSP